MPAGQFDGVARVGWGKGGVRVGWGVEGGGSARTVLGLPPQRSQGGAVADQLALGASLGAGEGGGAAVGPAPLHCCHHVLRAQERQAESSEVHEIPNR